jgi:hypothetical protein
VAVAALIAGAPKRNGVQERAIVADHRRLADDDAGGVIEHDAAADPRRGVNVHLKNARREALQVEREIVPPGVPKDVGEAERFERVVSLEIKQWIDQTPAGRIALGDGYEVGAKHVSKAWVGCEDFVKGLVQKPGVDGMLKPLRQAMADRVLKGRLAQDGCVDQARKHGLLGARLLRLAPHLLPYGVAAIDRSDLRIGEPRPLHSQILLGAHEG